MFVHTQMIENQEELRSALQTNQEQKDLIKQLQKEQTSGQDGAPDDKDELLTQVSRSNQENPNFVMGFIIFTGSLTGLVTSLADNYSSKNKMTAFVEDNSSYCNYQMKGLTEELESVKAERNGLYEMQNDALALVKEKDELQRRVISLGDEKEELQGRFATLNGEKEELQEIVDVLRQEKQQLKAELEDRMEMVCFIC